MCEEQMMAKAIGFRSREKRGASEPLLTCNRRTADDVGLASISAPPVSFDVPTWNPSGRSAEAVLTSGHLALRKNGLTI